MLNAADFDHRCAEPTCCVYGQRTTTNCLCHKPREQMLLEAIASARAEGWKAGIEAAAKVVLNHYIGPATSRAANYREANVTRPVLATAILALEEPRHE